MTFNIYSLWIDPVFYISVAVLILFIFLLIYSIRRYMAINSLAARQRDNEAESGESALFGRDLAEGGQEFTDENFEGEPLDTEVLQEQEMEDSAGAEAIGDRQQATEMPVENLEQEAMVNEAPACEEAFEKTVIAQPSEMPVESVAAVNEMPENVGEEVPVLEEVPVAEQGPVVEQAPVLQEQPTADLSKAEGFVKGIFNGIGDIDERLKAVESTLSERKLNGDFALRYLEDILDEYETMDKTAVKSRIEYLIADLKK